jgi:hypothetical protein
VTFNDTNLILIQPFLKMRELNSTRLHELPAGKAAHPVVMNPERLGYGPVLPYSIGDLVPSLLDAFFYGHGVDTKVVTCHYNSTYRGECRNGQSKQRRHLHLRPLPAVADRARPEVLQPARRQHRKQHSPRVVRNAGPALLVPPHAVPRDIAMSDAKISDEGCRRCDRLEDQLEVAEKQVKALRAQLRESGEYRDGLAAKVIELEGRLSEDRGNEWDEWLRERQDATGAFNPAKR